MPKEWRTKVSHRWEPEGGDGDPVSSFALFRDEVHQCRDGRTKEWRDDLSHKDTKLSDVILDGVTRRQLLSIVTGGAEMLAYADALDWNGSNE